MANEENRNCSRRSVLKSTAALISGGVLGSTLTACTDKPANKPEAVGDEPPPLPWEWPELDPLEAGRRAYKNYFIGGCGHGTYYALLSLLKEKVGYPWTTMPEKMMIHAAAGYGGHGTLCGTLGGTSVIINLVAYKDGDDLYRQIVDRLYYWYAQQNFPTNRFDDISQVPNQIQVQAMTPLCHTSVTKWMNAADATVTSLEKKERCAKVAGEVVYVTTQALNEYFAGTWTPAAWKPSKETEHCVTCHGPDDMFHTFESKDSQQGHMECHLCHDDHTM
ncbi:MAG: C-GCAxxG-C-C family (seleno)protein [Pseudomonadales bacterium]